MKNRMETEKGGRKEETARSRRTCSIVESFRKVFQFMTPIDGVTLGKVFPNTDRSRLLNNILIFFPLNLRKILSKRTRMI